MNAYARLPTTAINQQACSIRIKIVRCINVLCVTTVFEQSMACLLCHYNRAVNAFYWSLTSRVASLLWQTALSTRQIERWQQGSFC